MKRMILMTKRVFFDKAHNEQVSVTKQVVQFSTQYCFWLFIGASRGASSLQVTTAGCENITPGVRRGHGKAQQQSKTGLLTGRCFADFCQAVVSKHSQPGKKRKKLCKK